MEKAGDDVGYEASREGEASGDWTEWGGRVIELETRMTGDESGGNG